MGKSKKVEIIVIAAIGQQNQIGLKGQIPWYLPEDLKLFKEKTIGHSVIMGRNTFCGSGRAKPLPKRQNIIVSQTLKKQEGITLVSSFEEGIQFAKKSGQEKLFICGGTKIYKLGLEIADKLYLSYVNYQGEADAFFSEFNLKDWNILEENKYAAQDEFPAWTFHSYTKK